MDEENELPPITCPICRVCAEMERLRDVLKFGKDVFRLEVRRVEKGHPRCHRCGILVGYGHAIEGYQEKRGVVTCAACLEEMKRPQGDPEEAWKWLEIFCQTGTVPVRGQLVCPT